MGLQLFEIEFDSDSKTFFASQSMTGRVIVQIDHKEKRIQELVLRLWGKAEVSWVDPKKSKQKKPIRPKTSATPEIRISHILDSDISSSETKEKVFSNEETYFDRRHTVLEKSDKDDIIIQPGRNEYPFEIPLPSGIPNSFEGEHGSVKYYLEATMKSSEGGCDHTYRTLFYVKGILDLNSDPQAQLEKPEVSHEEHLCCLCCTSGPVGFHFGILGRGGIVPGDSMEFLADIYNMSDAKEVEIKLKFIQVTTYHAKPESIVVRKDLLKLRGPSVVRGGTGTWSGDSIHVPEGIVPTRLGARSTLISVEYCLQVYLEIPRGKKITAKIPILVGTIPFDQKIDEYIESWGKDKQFVNSDNQHHQISQEAPRELN